MKRSKLSEAPIAFISKQAEDETPVGEVCRKAGISGATYYNWRKKYAGHYLKPIGTRQVHRIAAETASMAGITKRVGPQLHYEPNGAIRIRVHRGVDSPVPTEMLLGK